MKPFKNKLLLNLIKYLLKSYKTIYINNNVDILNPIADVLNAILMDSRYLSNVKDYNDLSISTSRIIIFCRDKYRIAMESNGEIMLSFQKSFSDWDWANVYAKYDTIKERYILLPNTNLKLYPKHELKFIKKTINNLMYSDPVVYILDIYMNKI